MIMDFRSQEIPDDVPFEEYRRYVRSHIHYRFSSIPEEEWGEYEKKEEKNKRYREIVIFTLKSFVKRDGWTKHWLWIKEIVKKGYDLDISDEEMWKLFHKY